MTADRGIVLFDRTLVRAPTLAVGPRLAGRHPWWHLRGAGIVSRRAALRDLATE
jgi:hypothetical protein